MRRILLFVSLAASGFLAVWLFSGREQLVPPIPVTPSVEEGPVEPGEGFVEVLRQGLELRSKSLRLRSSRTREDPDGTTHTEVRYELAGEEFERPAALQRGGGIETFRVLHPIYRHYTPGLPEPWVTATGREAIVDFRAEEAGVLGQSRGEIVHVEITQGVHVEARLRAGESEAAATLEADRMRFDPGKGTGSIEGPVRVEGEGWTGTGVGLEADLESSRLVILRDVVIEGTTRAVEDPFLGTAPAPGEVARVRLEAAGPVHLRTDRPGGDTGDAAKSQPRPVHAILEGHPIVHLSDRRGEATLRAETLAADLLARVARPEDDRAREPAARLSSLRLERLLAGGGVRLSSTALDATAETVEVTGSPPDPVHITFTGASTFLFRQGITLPVIPGSGGEASVAKGSGKTLTARASTRAVLVHTNRSRSIQLEGNPVLEDSSGALRLTAARSLRLDLDAPREGAPSLPRRLETLGRTSLESPGVSVGADHLVWTRAEDETSSILLEGGSPSLRLAVAKDVAGSEGARDTMPASIQSEESLRIDHDPASGLVDLTASGPTRFRVGEGEETVALEASNRLAARIHQAGDGTTATLRSLHAEGDVSLRDARSGLVARAGSATLRPPAADRPREGAASFGDLWFEGAPATPASITVPLEGSPAAISAPRIRIGMASGEMEALGGVTGTVPSRLGPGLGGASPDPRATDRPESARVRCRRLLARLEPSATSREGGALPSGPPLRSLVAEGDVRIDGSRGERIEALRLTFDAAGERTRLEAAPEGLVVLEGPATAEGRIHLEAATLDLRGRDRSFEARDRVRLALPPGAFSLPLARGTEGVDSPTTLRARTLRGTLGDGTAGPIRSIQASSDVRIEGPGFTARGERFAFDTARGAGSLDAADGECIALHYEGRGIRLDARSERVLFSAPEGNPEEGEARLLGSPRIDYEGETALLPDALTLPSPLADPARHRAGAPPPSGASRLHLRCDGPMRLRQDGLVAERRVHIERDAASEHEEPWILEGSRLHGRFEEDPAQPETLRVAEAILEGPVRLRGASPARARELRYAPGEQRVFILGDARDPAWLQMREGVDLHASVIEVDLATGQALARRVDLHLAQKP